MIFFSTQTKKIKKKKRKKKEKKRERRRRKNSTLLSKLKTIKKTFNGNGLKYDTYLGRLRPFTLSWPK